MPIQGFTAPPSNAAAMAAPAPNTSPLAPGGGARKPFFQGIKSAAPRDPQPEPGYYEFEVVSGSVGRTGDWVKIQLRDTDGSNKTYTFLQNIGGDAYEVGRGMLKAFAMACIGADNDAEYDAFDPQGEFFNTVFGERNAYTEKGLTLLGKRVRARVSQGNPVKDKKTKQPTGEFHVNWGFEPVPTEAAGG